MQKEEVTFRSLLPSDYDDLIRLWQEAGLPYRPLGRDQREKILTELNNPFEMFILAFCHDRLVGSILASHDGRKGWLNRLCVMPDFRKQGLGRALIAEAEKFLENQGLEIFACLIEEENAESMKLFANAGYTRFDEIKYFTRKKHPDI